MPFHPWRESFLTYTFFLVAVYGVAMGVKRGRCQEENCNNCPRYEAADDVGEGGGPCSNCGHFPALHENLGPDETEPGAEGMTLRLFLHQVDCATGRSRPHSLTQKRKYFTTILIPLAFSKNVRRISFLLRLGSLPDLVSSGELGDCRRNRSSQTATGSVRMVYCGQRDSFPGAVRKRPIGEGVQRTLQGPNRGHQGPQTYSRPQRAPQLQM